MKRIFSILCALLAFWTLCCPAASVFAETQSAGVTLDTFDAKLRLNVSAQLSGQTVLDAYQKVVLFSDHAEITSASGAPRGDENEQIVLNPGERAVVYDTGSYLKIYTAVILQELAAEDGEGALASRREVDYETRTLYLAPNTSFAVTQGTDGLWIDLFHGSAVSAYSADPFRCASVFLRFFGAFVKLEEAYFAAGADESGTTCVHLGGNDPILLADGAAQTTLKQNDALKYGFSLQNGAFHPLDPDDLLAIGTEKNDADTIRLSALPDAVKKHSSIADGLIKLLETLGDHKPDVNSFLRSWETRLDEIERDFSGSDSGYARRNFVRLPMTADAYCTLFRLVGFPDSLDELSFGAPRLVRLPESGAGYIVNGAGGLIDLQTIPADGALEFSVMCAFPLADAGDSLTCAFGSQNYGVARADEDGKLWFSIPKSEALEQLNADPGSFLEIRCQTEKTYLSLPRTCAGYTVEPEETGLIELAPGEETVFTVRLNRALRAGESLTATQVSASGEQTLTPAGLSGAANAYTFTLVPEAGVNAVELEYDAAFKLQFERDLNACFAARLVGAPSKNQLPGGVPFAVRLVQTLPCDLIPVVFVRDAYETRVLEKDAFGNYVCDGLYADSTLSVTLGYPVTLPDPSPLYTVVPEDGYSDAYAKEGSTYAFKVVLSDLAPLGTSLIVRANGAILTPGVDGVYRIASVSEPINVQISTGVAFQVFLPTGDNYSASPYGGDSTTVAENGSFRFTLDVVGNIPSSQLIVAANNTVLQPEGGIYEITGINQDIYVTVRVISSFRVILPTGDGYSVFAYANSSTTVLAGGSFSFTIQTDSSVREGSVLTVTANNTVLYPSGGVYTINNIQSDTYVTVSLRRMYSVHLPASGGRYTVSASTDSVLYGESFTFAISSASGEKLTVRANGVPLSGSGVYTIPSVTCDQYVSVDGDDTSTYTVSLYGQATALSPLTVPMGGAFSFSVSSDHEPNVYVSGVSSGGATLVQTIPGNETSTYLYQIAGIYSNLTVNVS